MSAMLSVGAMARVQQGQIDFTMTVQVLKAKALPNDRYQLVISDGSASMMAMLATQCSSLMKGENAVRPGSILSVKKFMLAPAHEQKVVVLLTVELVCHQDISTSVGSMGEMSAAAPVQQAPVQQAPLYPPAPAAAGSSYGQSAAAYPLQPAYGQQPYSASTITSTGTMNMSASAFPSYNSNSTSGNSASGHQGAGAPGGYGSYGNPGSKPVQKEEAGGPILPISAINPYSNRWTIKARVTSKSQIRSWNNARGSGTLFSIDLLDSQAGEIRGTFFKDACDKFFPMIEEGRVYTFSGGTLKVVQNRQYSSIKNQYELTFNINSVIAAASDASDIRQQNFNFVKVNALGNMEVGATVDVIGVVRQATDVSEIVSQKQGGKTLKKRELTVADDSMNEIRVTLWGEKAESESYSWHENPIVAFKGLKVGDYGGRSLSAMGSTALMLNPQIPEGFELHQWREGLPQGLGAISAQFSSLSTGGGGGGGGAPLGQEKLEERKPVSGLKDGSMGMGEKPDYATVKGTITFIKHDTDPFYSACSQPNCNKKVVSTGGDQYTCEKCNVTTPTCDYRYILSMTVADHSGNTWVTLFNETAEKLLGVSAQQLSEMRSAGDEASYEKVFSDVLFKTFIGRVRVKQEQMNDEQRIKVTALNMAELDYAAESLKLIEAINTCMM